MERSPVDAGASDNNVKVKKKKEKKRKKQRVLIASNPYPPVA